MQSKRLKAKRNSALKAFVFFVALFVLMLFSLILPLRPTYSEMEKRPLAEFPSFSWAALANGSYFLDIDTWFSDTFPLRDGFFAIKDSVTNLYGYKGGGEVTGPIKKGDEIPDTPFTGN